MSVWRTTLFLVGLMYVLTGVHGQSLPAIIKLDTGTSVVPKWSNRLTRDKHVCEPGFVSHPKNVTLCLPLCESGCPHGYCKSPGVCGCLQNHVEIFGECKPTCVVDGTCAHGECVGGMCTNCMPGYKTVSSGLYCEPRCETVQCDFKTQICNAPETCTCRLGYKWQYNKCVPTCETNCLHGECVAPGQCQCYKGTSLKDGICQANCWMDCSNGICVQENVCECRQGFSLGLPSLKCIETCPGCDYGKCIAPNQCRCNGGYKWSNSKKRCKPVCKGCYGWGQECAAPNKCQCKTGYLPTKLNPLKCKSNSGVKNFFRKLGRWL